MSFRFTWHAVTAFCPLELHKYGRAALDGRPRYPCRCLRQGSLQSARRQRGVRTCVSSQRTCVIAAKNRGDTILGARETAGQTCSRAGAWAPGQTGEQRCALWRCNVAFRPSYGPPTCSYMAMYDFRSLHPVQVPHTGPARPWTTSSRVNLSETAARRLCCEPSLSHQPHLRLAHDRLLRA